jgi:hypothetical protein
MRKIAFVLLFVLIAVSPGRIYAGVFGQIHGVVHDPQHRPITGAHIVIKSATSSFAQTTLSGSDGSFSFSSISLGDYLVTVSSTSFETTTQSITLASNTSPVLHFDVDSATPPRSSAASTSPRPPAPTAPTAWP